MLRRLLNLSLAFLLLSVPLYAAGPKSWNKKGTATTNNATLTVGGASSPFGPVSVCIENTGATNDLWVDWTDGVATTTDDSTNISIAPGVSYCLPTNNCNVSNTMTIGVITSAATTTYHIVAVACR